MDIKKLIKAILPKEIVFEIGLNLRRLKSKKIIRQTQSHYKEVETKIRHRDGKLRVGAYAVYDTTFGACTLFDLMLAQPKKYDVKVVVIPDISRGILYQKQQYLATKRFFEKRFGSQFVADGYNLDTGEFLDYSLDFDVIYCANPYDNMVNIVHGVKYLSKKNVLPIYISYGCYVDNYGYKTIMPLLEISLFWKVFADDVFSYKAYKKYELCKGKNVLLFGYAKMDSFASFKKMVCKRKRIIIAPHHTIKNKVLPLSNFLALSDFILELPRKYPEIEFIFRPHPLLFINMINEGVWTDKKVEQYIANIKDSGMIYSVGGDYFDIFVNSDAIIHDCASFIYEYLFTNNPCCFVAKKGYKKVISSLGKACLKNYTIAFNKNQIEDFVEKVVIASKDVLRESREHFTTKYLKLNYPSVSARILEELLF
ncbi:MAG: hypothetical protein HDR32_07480 [Treponema sp.]|nr:hypothetical protein [Treponema sp.]